MSPDQPTPHRWIEVFSLLLHGSLRRTPSLPHIPSCGDPRLPASPPSALSPTPAPVGPSVPTAPLRVSLFPGPSPPPPPPTSPWGPSALLKCPHPQTGHAPPAPSHRGGPAGAPSPRAGLPPAPPPLRRAVLRAPRQALGAWSRAFSGPGPWTARHEAAAAACRRPAARTPPPLAGPPAPSLPLGSRRQPLGPGCEQQMAAPGAPPGELSGVIFRAHQDHGGSPRADCALQRAAESVTARASGAARRGLRERGRGRLVPGQR